MKKNIKEKEESYGHPLSMEEAERVYRRVTQPGYRRINQCLKPNATTEDRIKYNLCKSIVGYAIKNNLTEEDLKKKLSIGQVELEYALFCHVDKLNIPKLISYTDSLHISLEIKITNQYGFEETASRSC